MLCIIDVCGETLFCSGVMEEGLVLLAWGLYLESRFWCHMVQWCRSFHLDRSGTLGGHGYGPAWWAWLGFCLVGVARVWLGFCLVGVARVPPGVLL